MSRSQMKNLALGLLTKNVHRVVRSTRDYGVGIALNGISTIGDYIFLDVSFTNTSNLSYNVDELRFFIEDKKITKATNVQTVEIKPLWQYQPLTDFKKRHRNVFVLKKATFPGSKVLRVTAHRKTDFRPYGQPQDKVRRYSESRHLLVYYGLCLEKFVR